MQNSFLIYADYEKHFNRLNYEQRGKLITAIFALNRGEDLTETLDPAGQMALSFIQDQMKRDSEAYEISKMKRSEAGKRGMEARWGRKNDNEVITNDNKNNNVINVITDDNTPITNDNNHNYNVDVNVNENVDVNVTQKKKKKETVALTDAEILSYVKENIKQPTIQARFIDYIKNRKAMGSKYAIKTIATLTLNINNLKKWAKTVEQAVEILDYSIANNYQGLFNIYEKQQKTAPTVEKIKVVETVSTEEADAWSES